jgi:hypothetical protein
MQRFPTLFRPLLLQWKYHLAQNESSIILASRATRFPAAMNDYVLSKQTDIRLFFFQKTLYSLIPFIEKCVQLNSSILFLDSFEI